MCITDEITSHTVWDGATPLRVDVRPLGVFWGVFVDEAEEPLSVGRTPRIARLGALRVLRSKLSDLRAVVRGEGRAQTLYKRLVRTLLAIEELEMMA